MSWTDAPGTDVGDPVTGLDNHRGWCPHCWEQFKLWGPSCEKTYQGDQRRVSAAGHVDLDGNVSLSFVVIKPGRVGPFPDSSGPVVVEITTAAGELLGTFAPQQYASDPGPPDESGLTGFWVRFPVSEDVDLPLRFTAYKDGEVTSQVTAGGSAPTVTVWPIEAECDALGGATVVLQSDAQDPDGDTVYATWEAEGVLLEPVDATTAVGFFPLGTTTVRVTVKDGTGEHEAQAETTVTVRDETPPVLVFEPEVVATTCTSVDLGQATAIDACGGEVPIFNDAPPTFTAGVDTVTWEAVDQHGNVSAQTQTVAVGVGDDPACCPPGTNVMVGTSNNDTLIGTPGSDCIVALGAQDVIQGLGGDDFLSGGDGDDLIEGGDGNDFIEGGTGQEDTLRGDAGDDTILGGDGDDACYGSTGNDRLHGGQGQDDLFGEDGNDLLFGDIGDDVLDGGAGDDLLNGGGLHDQCFGGEGNNTYVTCDNEPDTNPVPPPPPVEGEVHATLSLFTDWGGGYCVGINVTNPGTEVATGFTVTVDTHEAEIYDIWNASSSAATGEVTIVPDFWWGVALDPGATDSSMGFCANRAVPGTPTATIVSTSAEF
jgi:Ca2+-binding RTX toxin-like protein